VATEHQASAHAQATDCAVALHIDLWRFKERGTGTRTFSLTLNQRIKQRKQAMIPKRGATRGHGTQAPSLLQALRLAPKILCHVLERNDGQRKWQNDSFSVRPFRRLKNPEQLDSYSDGVLLAGDLCGY